MQAAIILWYSVTGVEITFTGLPELANVSENCSVGNLQKWSSLMKQNCSQSSAWENGFLEFGLRNANCYKCSMIIVNVAGPFLGYTEAKMEIGYIFSMSQPWLLVFYILPCMYKTPWQQLQASFLAMEAISLTILSTFFNVIVIPILLLSIPHMLLIFYICYMLAKKTGITQCLQMKYNTWGVVHRLSDPQVKLTQMWRLSLILVPCQTDWSTQESMSQCYPPQKNTQLLTPQKMKTQESRLLCTRTIPLNNCTIIVKFSVICWQFFSFAENEIEMVSHDIIYNMTEIYSSCITFCTNQCSLYRLVVHGKGV